MSKDKIEISLMHILDRTIHEGEIILTGDYPNCGILFTSSIIRDIKVKGHDYYQCLLNLRIELEKQKYYILCQGARRDLSCGGMLRQSSDGCLAYVIRLGEYCYLDEDVEIFDYAEPDLVVSVKEQEEFHKLHGQSLPEIINYYAQFSESISSQTRENIIDRLCSHSDWQLLQRKNLLSILNVIEGDRLLFKVLNTPDRPHWNIELEIYNDSIKVILTLGNDRNREIFLTFLNQQLSLNG
ncbi:MAG: hypothetical protein QNJ38_12855, partial [Prochloraceae cyanobacterium]|nr:hypothetical protein [Prochloraceae cyanobacterium]